MINVGQYIYPSGGSLIQHRTVDILLGCRSTTKPRTLMAMIVQLGDRHQFQTRDSAEQAPHILSHAVYSMVLMQGDAFAHGLHEVLLQLWQMRHEIPRDVSHGEVRCLWFEHKVLHVDVAGWTPGEHFLGREGSHIAQGLCGLGVRYGRFPSPHEGDATAVACATQDLVIHSQVIQDIQHGQGNLRRAQDVTAEVEDHVRRPLPLADRAWEQALNIFGVQLHAEQESQGSTQRFKIVACRLLRRLRMAGSLLPTQLQTSQCQHLAWVHPFWAGRDTAPTVGATQGPGFGFWRSHASAE